MLSELLFFLQARQPQLLDARKRTPAFWVQEHLVDQHGRSPRPPRSSGSRADPWARFRRGSISVDRAHLEDSSQEEMTLRSLPDRAQVSLGHLPPEGGHFDARAAAAEDVRGLLRIGARSWEASSRCSFASSIRQALLLDATDSGPLDSRHRRRIERRRSRARSHSADPLLRTGSGLRS